MKTNLPDRIIALLKEKGGLTQLQLDLHLHVIFVHEKKEKFPYFSLIQKEIVFALKYLMHTYQIVYDKPSDTYHLSNRLQTNEVLIQEED